MSKTDGNGWSLSRIVLLLDGVFFLFVFAQVTLFHLRQNFRHWSMWIPVIETPILGLASIVSGFYDNTILRTTVMILLTIGFVSGLIGTFMHVRGVGVRVGGYAFRNFQVGPPPVLPFLITGLSLLGFLTLLWR